MSSHSINKYTITKVKAIRGGYSIDYGGSSNLSVWTDECNFIPQKGQTIVVGLVLNKVTSIVINGRKVR